jgi:hypothetical protein
VKLQCLPARFLKKMRHSIHVSGKMKMIRKARFRMTNEPRQGQSLLKLQLRTSFLLWAVISAGLFIWLGTNTHWGKASERYWELWQWYIQHPSFNLQTSYEEGVGLVVVGFVLAIPSIVLGWVGQAITVGAATIFRQLFGFAHLPSDDPLPSK